MRIGPVVRSAGGFRAGRHPQEAGGDALRGRGPRRLLPGERRPALAVQVDADEPWRRGDRSPEGGLRLLGAQLQQCGLSRFFVCPDVAGVPQSAGEHRGVGASPAVWSLSVQPRRRNPRLVRHLDAADQRDGRQSPGRGQPLPGEPCLRLQHDLRGGDPVDLLLSSGSSTSCGGPSLAYCAYHGSASGAAGTIVYTIQPYPSCSGCKWGHGLHPARCRTRSTSSSTRPPRPRPTP